MSTGFYHGKKVVQEIGIKTGMRIADFGCGAGYWSVLFAQTVGQEGKITALDVLETALQSVQSKAKIDGVNNIETVRANLETFGSTRLADNSQDVVWLGNILFQSNKKIDILKEASRILKTGGKLAMMEWLPGTNFGPPENLKLKPEAAKTLVQSLGLKLEKESFPTSHHYELIFIK